MEKDEEKTEKWLVQLEKLTRYLETMRIAEYVQLLEKPTRLLALNFVAGIARGLGIAFGATLIFALLIDVLRRLILWNIPGIGSFIAEIVRVVEMKNGQY